MATRYTYNHSAKRFLSGENAVGDSYKVVLLNTSGSFNAAHTTLAEVTDSGNDEVYGNGWDQGGEEIQNLGAVIINTNEAAITGDDIAVTLVGGNLGPFLAYVIANVTDSGSPPVEYVVLDASTTVNNGYIVQIPWTNSRVFTAAPS